MSIEVREETLLDLAEDAIKEGEKDNNDLLVFGLALKAILEKPPLDEKQRKLLGRGISRAYHAAMATPPFYKGSSTDKLIAIMESWGVDFSRVDLKQFENIRMED